HVGRGYGITARLEAVGEDHLPPVRLDLPAVVEGGRVVLLALVVVANVTAEMESDALSDVERVVDGQGRLADHRLRALEKELQGARHVAERAGGEEVAHEIALAQHDDVGVAVVMYRRRAQRFDTRLVSRVAVEMLPGHVGDGSRGQARPEVVRVPPAI